MEDNLPLLRDIHLPADVSAFPPGYGWFVLIAVTCATYFIYKFSKAWYIKSKKLYALRLLKNAPENNIQTVRLASEILRRICRLKFPEAVSLSGTDWLNFLNTHSKNKLKGKAADLLLYAPYMAQSKNFKEPDFEEVRLFIQKWIGENL